MKRTCLHIFLGILLAGLLSSCKKGEEIIPRADMSHIYADILVADAWLNMAEPEARSMADTTAFYEPIFKKYGYTTSDYLASVEYYLNDPGRFARILRKSNQILESEVSALQTAQSESEKGKKKLKLEGVAGTDSDGLSYTYTDYSKLMLDAFFTDRMTIALTPDGVYLPSRPAEAASYRGPGKSFQSEAVEKDEGVRKVSHVLKPEQ